MKTLRLFAALLSLSLPLRAIAQEAHSQAIGGAASAAPLGIFSLVWNPSMLTMPDSTDSLWSIGSGFTAYDSSNSGVPILHFVPENGLGAGDPVLRSQDYQGIFAVKYLSMAGAVIHDQSLTYAASQGALQFFHDRDLGLGSGASYAVELSQTTQEIGTVIFSYGSMLPFGSSQLFSIGGNLKYHDGLQYEQVILTGTYTQGSSTGYSYTKTTSSSGLGLSMDLGISAKISDALQMGLMIENIQSNFTWKAQQRTYTLDPVTGAETASAPVNLDVQAPFPYATKLGAAMMPPDKNIALEAEVSWSQNQTRWRAGMERYYPETNLIVRFGTFSDQISNQQMWAFGIGYVHKVFSVDASFVTRSIPDLQNSIGLGGGIDAIVRF